MSDDALVPLNPDGYLAFFAGLAIIMLALFWFHQRSERIKRKRFFARYNVDDLRMSPYRIGYVYRVVSSEDTETTVIPVWGGNAKIVDGKEQRLASEKLIPFDESRFL